MTRLAWDSMGERVYEAGLDRGVLYPAVGPGVAWNGLVSVQESAEGGEVGSYYQNGKKFAVLFGVEEFRAEIEAYTYPEEFDASQGNSEIANGLYTTQQDRAPFGMSYRTKVGNDVEGLDHGYKIHIVYNAYVEPSDKTYTSVSDSIEPTNFNWSIVTIPQEVPEKRPSAHFEIDSRTTTPFQLDFIEGILYGSAGEDPRLPDLDELVTLFVMNNLDILDGGFPDSTHEYEYDGGFPESEHIRTFDGGSPL